MSYNDYYYARTLPQQYQSRWNYRPQYTGNVPKFTPQGYSNYAFFPKEEGRYNGILKIEAADGRCYIEVGTASLDCARPVKILADTGADVTLLRSGIAGELGYDISTVYDSFPVQGINGDTVEFKELNLKVQIGNMRPIVIPIGFAPDPESLVENLMGAKGILDTGKIEAVYDNQGVLFRHKGMNTNFL